MSTATDIEKLQEELVDVRALLEEHDMGHYWNPNVSTFATTVLNLLKKKVDQ